MGLENLACHYQKARVTMLKLPLLVSVHKVGSINKTTTKANLFIFLSPEAF